jgi:hypothetical protein
MLLSEVSDAPYEGRFQQSTSGGISQTLIHLLIFLILSFRRVLFVMGFLLGIFPASIHLIHLLEVLYNLSIWPDMIYIYATLRPHYPREKDLVTFVQEAGWAPESVWTVAENLAYPGIRSPNRPAHSESLYRLSPHSPDLIYKFCFILD